MKITPEATLSIEFREIGDIDESEKEYLAHFAKFIIEFSKAEHNLDEAIMAAFKYDREFLTRLSPRFPQTMKEKLTLMLRFCKSVPEIKDFTQHIQNRLNELDRAMAMRNTICHGYLHTIDRRTKDPEFQFTRWTRSDKFSVRQVTTKPTLSQIVRHTRAICVWKALFGELESQIQTLSSATK